MAPQHICEQKSSSPVICQLKASTDMSINQEFSIVAIYVEGLKMKEGKVLRSLDGKKWSKEGEICFDQRVVDSSFLPSDLLSKIKALIPKLWTCLLNHWFTGLVLFQKSYYASPRVAYLVSTKHSVTPVSTFYAKYPPLFVCEITPIFFRKRKKSWKILQTIGSKIFGFLKPHFIFKNVNEN